MLIKLKGARAVDQAVIVAAFLIALKVGFVKEGYFLI
jgi:hypothetical protein